MRQVLMIPILFFRWNKTVFLWPMPGEVYRENSSDDAQGYQPFITYSWNYLTCANFYGYFILIHKFGKIGWNCKDFFLFSEC